MEVHEQHKSKGPEEIKTILVVVSTSRYQEFLDKEESSDKTIPLVMSILDDHPNITLTTSMVIPDSTAHIKKVYDNLINMEGLHAIIFSGGTGLSPKDITYETIEPLFEKRIDGFGEIFRSLSYKEIGASAMLSRAVAGKIKDKAVFLLPGSPNAVKLALNELIIPELGHIVYIINKEE
jgi:molybdenum cofactor biosynthesis protein B